MCYCEIKKNSANNSLMQFFILKLYICLCDTLTCLDRLIILPFSSVLSWSTNCLDIIFYHFAAKLLFFRSYSFVHFYEKCILYHVSYLWFKIRFIRISYTLVWIMHQSVHPESERKATRLRKCVCIILGFFIIYL